MSSARCTDDSAATRHWSCVMCGGEWWLDEPVPAAEPPSPSRCTCGSDGFVVPGRGDEGCAAAADGRLTVALDVDDVLARFSDGFVAWRGAGVDRGAAAAAELVRARGIESALGLTRGEAIAEVRAFFGVDAAGAAGLAPAVGAREVLAEFAPRVRFVACTARDACAEAATRAWLDEHFPGLVPGLLMGNLFGREGERASKPDMVRRCGGALLVDDNPAYCEQCAADGIPALRFGGDPDLPGRALVSHAATWEDVRVRLRALVGDE